MKKMFYLAGILLAAIACSERNSEDQLFDGEKHVSIVSPSGETLYDYMDHPDLDAPVKSFLEGSMVPQNNDETESLLATLVNHSGELTSLYFGVFNKICKEADEDMSELLGPAAMRLLENHTAFCIASLHNGAPDYFTGHISNALYGQDGWENTLKIYSANLYKKIGDDPELIMELNHLLEGINNDIDHLRIEE